MRLKSQKGRCTKISLEKNRDVCRCYDKLMEAYARQLATDENVSEFAMNIPLSFERTTLPDDLPSPARSHTTDFYIKWRDGTIAIREAVFRHHLPRPSTAEKLQLSKIYWERKGVSDWGIVIEKES